MAFDSNKYSEAIKSMSKAGRINGKPLKTNTIRVFENFSAFDSTARSIDEQSNKISIIDLLKSRVLAFRLVVASMVWFCTWFAYHGTLFNSVNVHSNKYLSQLFYHWLGRNSWNHIINTFLMNRLGRKMTIVPAMLTYGLLLLVSTQTPVGSIYQLILFFIGKIVLTAGTNGLNTFLSEIWPTSVRNSAYSTVEPRKS